MDDETEALNHQDVRNVSSVFVLLVISLHFVRVSGRRELVLSDFVCCPVYFLLSLI